MLMPVDAEQTNIAVAVQQYAREHEIRCLHIGLYEDYCEAIWDENYRVPGDVAGDVCEYPLARNLVLIAVVLGSELVVRSILHDQYNDYSGTLQDFAIHPLEVRQ